MIRKSERRVRYLQKLSHPLVDLHVKNGLNLPHVTPGSLLSGLELAITFNLPKKSISGLPILNQQLVEM